MPLLFEQLPTDITLEVVKLLELPDPLSLLLTCSSLYKLSNDNIFWISVLETTRKKYPIGCPVYADLSQYTLEALKGLVVSWMKLQHSWDQPSPKIVQPVTSTPLSERARIIFNVQGTDILVLAIEGRVFCWDAKLAASFPFPPIEIGGHITGVSDPADAPSTCSFAILVEPFHNHHILNLGSGNSSRYVIVIRHANGKATSFTSQFSGVSQVDDDRDIESLFLTEDMVGRTVVMGSKEDCIVTIGAVSGDNYLADSTSVLKLHRPVSNGDFFVSFAYQGHLYNLLENDFSVEIHHISRKSLQSGRCEESGLHSSEILSSDPDGSTPFCYLTPSAPSYGIGAVFVRRTWVEPDVMNTSFTFLPSTLTHVLDDGVSSPLAFDSPCVTARISGDLNHLGLVWLDHSGFNLVAVIQPNPVDLSTWLLLVRYHPDTRSISTHKLDVPDTIDLSNLESLCVDDTAGAVHLVDNEGILSTLRYV
ncbi:hypothetical protein B0H14DRAFT_2830889 [Mycena olivaceomarginata]|nr:hypothetical protein B0H14DRAFT_2830889 [Mycena olivaceomarginata]